jgi:hypothetical protein
LRQLGSRQASPGPRDICGSLGPGQREAGPEQPHTWLANAGCSSGVPPRHTLQTQNKAMAAQTHNPTPAAAQDTPTYAKVTINATQASTRKMLIRHPYEETPHQSRDDPTSRDCPGTDWDFAPIGKRQSRRHDLGTAMTGSVINPRTLQSVAGRTRRLDPSSACREADRQ